MAGPRRNKFMDNVGVEERFNEKEVLGIRDEEFSPVEQRLSADDVRQLTGYRPEID